MKIEFTKMQGCGNDYVYINGFTQKIAPDKKKDLVIKLSDRHFGIGSDGVIFINPSDRADFEMEMYNADGSRSEMCGNGIRCVAKYVYDHGMTDKCDITIGSFGKIKPISITLKEGRAHLIRVDMGEPVLDPELIPVRPKPGRRGAGSSVPERETKAGSGTTATLTEDNEPVSKEIIDESERGTAAGIIREENKVINVPIPVGGREYRMTCVSMGNPHAVIFVDRTGRGGNEQDRPVSDPGGLTAFPDFKKEGGIENIGPLIENHSAFPNRTNVEFVRVDDRNNVHMRVWERGTGETLACGTGCCATAVACVLNGLTDRSVTVHVPGGDILVEWDEGDNHVYMTGPAVTVFDGVVNV